MKIKVQKDFVTLSILFIFGLSFSGCGTTGGVVINGGNGSGNGHPPIVKKGPPAHAPAHGYRAKYRYRYYPSCSVYYDCGRKIYFYLSGDRWEVGASLPSHFRIRLGDSVNMEMHTDKPYIHHAEHVKKYPPGQLKKTHKKKHKWS
jgi:hypothetical protein